MKTLLLSINEANWVGTALATLLADLVGVGLVAGTHRHKREKERERLRLSILSACLPRGCVHLVCGLPPSAHRSLLSPLSLRSLLTIIVISYWSIHMESNLQGMDSSMQSEID
ncbi:hypothetical protein F0562_005897 [Nyssa sinensis]|uniref:Uncharacterized protein n=1 Tax=Nyssa sinensis TaxID=561372 RepID=A0A5J5ALW6_9ASTE|nr:hypothetical protein F0562_005897 [Nyssa sinensis]